METERKQLLEMYADLRVADVRDGMDRQMMHHYGSMSPEIHPLWRTRATGIARTVRYVPYEGTIPQMTPEEYGEWSSWYGREKQQWKWEDETREGDFVVIDQSGMNVGLMGSFSALRGVSNGARGYVTNGGVRDTDELIRTEVPFWSRSIAQTMVQGRIQFEAKDVTVSVGGVVVNPGDIVVADGDGVIVVPRKLAVGVAEWAHKTREKDMRNRRRVYEKMGRELDETV